MKQLARNVRLTYDGKELPGVTDCGLSLTTVFASSQAKEDPTPVDEPLRVDWEISVSAEFGREATSLIGGHAIKRNSLIGAVKPVEYVIGDYATYTGNVMITSFSESAPVEGKLTYTATLKGVSTLTRKFG